MGTKEEILNWRRYCLQKSQLYSDLAAALEGLKHKRLSISGQLWQPDPCAVQCLAAARRLSSEQLRKILLYKERSEADRDYVCRILNLEDHSAFAEIRRGYRAEDELSPDELRDLQEEEARWLATIRVAKENAETYSEHARIAAEDALEVGK